MGETHSNTMIGQYPDAETARQAVLDEMLAEAAFDGWTPDTLRAAGLAADLSPEDLDSGVLALHFPRGIEDVLDFWASEEDRMMQESYRDLDAVPAKIREKVTWLVRRRIEQMSVHREAARRAAATMALPHLAGLGPRLAWRTAGTIWQTLGDRSLDGNYYSKRAILSGVYLSTLARWFADEDDGSDTPFKDTWAFLDRRIDNVMQIEKAKAQAKKVTPNFEGLVGTLAKMRYGDR